MKTCLITLSLAASATAAFAASIANPSFEVDSHFTNFPGYISSNGNIPISNWADTNAAQTGLQNAGNGSPFANNGVYPNGTQVAFIQTAGNTNSLTNSVTGLTVGQQYQLSVRVTSRGGYAVPQATMSVGADSIGFFTRSVGATDPYHYVVKNFTATSTTLPLTITSSTTGDGALVLDDFQINPITGSPFSISPWNDDASSGINSAYTYTHAYNFGSATNLSINGVSFTGIAAAAPSAGNFSLTGTAAAFPNSPNNGVTGNSATMGNDFIYGGNVGTLTLSGLTPGQQYRTTIFGMGWGSEPYRTTTFEANGVLFSADEETFGSGKGIRMEYEFTASGSTQTINYDAVGTPSWHWFGMANAAIPEPGSAALALMASLGLLRRRR